MDYLLNAQEESIQFLVSFNILSRLYYIPFYVRQQGNPKKTFLNCFLVALYGEDNCQEKDGKCPYTDSIQKCQMLRPDPFYLLFHICRINITLSYKTCFNPCNLRNLWTLALKFPLDVTC